MLATEKRPTMRDILDDAITKLAGNAAHAASAEDAALYAKAAVDLTSAVTNLMMTGIDR